MDGHVQGGTMNDSQETPDSKLSQPEPPKEPGADKLLPWDEEMEDAMLRAIEKYNEERT